MLLGSGETAPGAQKIYHRLFAQLGQPIHVAILETPAGFEPNSDYVAAQVGRYLEKRLQNFRPVIDVVPARRLGTPFSPDNPDIVAALHGADVIFMGPGSPTYAIRQLRNTLAWHTLRTCHRLGAALIFASAATLALSAQTVPVYEIYKAGEDLHWKQGLDFFADYGLSTIFVPHWNNTDGGDVLDTSRCYLGQSRFETMVAMLPAGSDAYTMVGIDENTALMVEPAAGQCTVMGAGQVTVLRARQTKVFGAGQTFPATELGAFSVPEPAAGIPEPVWRATVQGWAATGHARTAQPEPDAGVLSLLEERNAARAAKNWAASDQLRDLIAARGWRVLDTPAGPVLEPERDQNTDERG